MPVQPLALTPLVERDAGAPLRAVACRIDAEGAVFGHVVELRGPASVQMRHRVRRRDLAQQRDDLLAGERRLGHGTRCPRDLELGELALVQLEGGGALAHHDGQEAVELGHAAQVMGRTYAI